MASFVSRIFSQLRKFGTKLLTREEEVFNMQVKLDKFDLDALIQASEFNDDGGAKKAADWVKEQLRKKVYKPYHGFMEPGKLYFVSYPNPKHRATLDFYDTQPLVLALGTYTTKDNRIIEIGINLHHLPMKVRRQILVRVFDMFRRKYKGQMYRANQEPIPMNWSILANPLLPYGAAFAFRSYIPNRRTHTIEFKYEDWDKAVFVPSERYVGITQQQLEIKWKEFTLTKSWATMSASRMADILGSY